MRKATRSGDLSRNNLSREDRGTDKSFEKMFHADYPLFAHYKKHNIVFFAFCNEQLKANFGFNATAPLPFTRAGRL